MDLIFIDTEFTKFSNPELISIGLASSGGENFYAEVDFPETSCSEFVRESIIPLLSGTERISHESLRIKILEWLESIQSTSPIIICFDSEYDRVLFLRIFDNHPPSFLFFRGIGYRHIDGLKRADFYLKNKLVEHHALNDAMALRYAFRGWTRPVR